MPASQCGSLIGKQGCKIKEIREVSAPSSEAKAVRTLLNFFFWGEGEWLGVRGEGNRLVEGGGKQIGLFVSLEAHISGFLSVCIVCFLSKNVPFKRRDVTEVGWDNGGTIVVVGK